MAVDELREDEPRVWRSSPQGSWSQKKQGGSQPGEYTEPGRELGMQYIRAIYGNDENQLCSHQASWEWFVFMCWSGFLFNIFPYLPQYLGG